MTKGQNKAIDFIEEFIDSESSSFTWEELSKAVKDSGAKVSNWMTIRGVLQWFINEGLIKRTRNSHREEYIKA